MGILLYLFGLIISFIIVHTLIKSAVREVILEAKDEIMQDLRGIIKGAIVQAEKDLTKVSYEDDASNNHIIDRRI